MGDREEGIDVHYNGHSPAQVGLQSAQSEKYMLGFLEWLNRICHNSADGLMKICLEYICSEIYLYPACKYGRTRIDALSIA